MSLDVKTTATESQKTDYHFWLTFEHAVIGMALVLPDGRFRRANLELQRLLGATERELRQLDLSNVTHQDDVAEEVRLFKQVLKDELPAYRYQKTFLCRDGTSARATVSATVVRDQAGKPLHFIYMVNEMPVQSKSSTGKLGGDEQDEGAHQGQIINSFGDAAIFHTPGGIITRWNEATERLYGYSARKMLGKPVSMLFRADHRHDWAEILQVVANGERVKDHETLHVAADGRNLMVSLNVTPLVDEMDNFSEALTVVHDLTERKLLADEVQENRNVMAQVLEGVPVGLYLADPDGVPFYANETAIEMLGPGILPGDNPDDGAEAYPLCVVGTDEPYDPENLPTAYAMMGKPAMVDDIEVHHPQGSRPMQMWGQPVLDTAGEVTYVLAVFREIADRRTVEGALVTAEDRYKAVCENIPDLISVHDLRGQYLYASPACTRILGYAPDQMVKTDIRIYIHPEDLPVVSKTFGRYFAGSDEHMKATYRVRRKDGSYIWMETAARPVIGTYGLRREILGVSRSLEETADMKASLVEERRRNTTGELERVNAELRDKLTGLKNRRGIDEYLSKKLQSRRSSTYPIGCLLVDIDNMKELNTRHGQEVGDEVIKIVADVVDTACRGEDFVGRLTSDKFLVVLPNTDAPGTVVVGEKLVANVRNAKWPEALADDGVTVSVGGTCIVRYSGLTESGLLEILDAQLHEAKQAGRNRFIMNARRMASTGSDWSHAARR